MIRQLILWSVANPLLVLVLAAAAFVFGGVSALRMPVDVFPDLTAPTVTVMVEGRGMSPLQMETLVTVPIEAAVNGAAQVRRVRSATAVGLAVVWIEFDWGADIHRARMTVSERLAALAGSLPEEVSPPLLAPISSIMGEILFVGLTSSTLDDRALRALATLDLRRRLLKVGGVSQITVLGGETKQFQVVLSPERLRDFAVSGQQVTDAIAASNANLSAGILVRGGQESLIEGYGRLRGVEDIAAVAVAERGGRPVLVRDLGVVEIGSALRRGTAAVGRRDASGAPVSEPGVILAIQKQTGVNTLTLTRALEDALAEAQRSLPEGTTLHLDLLRQADFIEASVANTTTALVEGAGVVLLIVVLFLASLQASLITLLAIPLSLMAAILVLRAMGMGVDTMTLGGMAIAIGALVDDAIIDVENVVRRLRENARLPIEQRRPGRAVVLDASIEVRASIVFATWIILLVFTPLFVLEGVEGRLLQPLGLAFAAGLAGSLLVALTVTPALCALLLPRSRTVQVAEASRVVRGADRLYAGPLRAAMRRPGWVLCAAGLLFGLGGWQASRFGGAFLPEFNEGSLVVGLVTAPGTSLEASDRLARLAELALLAHPEVVTVGRRTGRAEEDEHVQGVEASELDVTLDMDAGAEDGRPRRSKEELFAALRADLAALPGLQATFGQPISHRIDHMLSGTRASVAVKLFGPELCELRRLGAEIEDVMRGVPGVADLSLEQQTDVPFVRVEFERDALARAHLRTDDAAGALARAGAGQIATEVFEGTTAYELSVRTAAPVGLTELEALAAAPVGGVDAAPVPLRAVARVQEDLGPNFISREGMQRKIVAQCNVAGRDLRSVVEEVRARVEQEVALPPGYFVEYGGQFESAERTERRLLLLGAVILVGMLLLLLAALRSLRDSLLVMCSLPLALVGGVYGVALSGGVLSVASMIGFITVFGIAARNGILMVTHVRHLQREEGVTDLDAAIERGARERLSPILMTALAAGLALLPLALRGEEPGTEILTPMAIVILCGLLTSTFLNLLVMPAMMKRFGGGGDGGGGGAARGGGALLLVTAASCGAVEPAPDLGQTRAWVEASTGVTWPEDAILELQDLLADGLGLEEAMRAALLHEPALQARFAEVGLARADLEQAGLLRNPSLSLLFLFPEGGVSPNVQLGVLQSIAELWRRPSRTAAAGHALEAALLDASRAAGAAAMRARAAYFALLAARDASAIAAEERAFAARRAERFRKELAAGAVAASEASIAVAALAAAELAALRAADAVRAAAAELALAIGWSGDLEAVVLLDALPAPAASAPALEDALARAREHRLDLRAAAARVRAAEEERTAAERAAWPEFAVGASAERPEGGGASLFGPAFELELPFFDRRQAVQLRAWFALERARWEAEGLHVALEHEVRAALAVVALRGEQARRIREHLLAPAVERARHAEFALRSGDLEWREAEAQEAEVLRLRGEALAAEHALARAWTDLALVTATPWP
jgi:CzcA family heavy metal efflux pump